MFHGEKNGEWVEVRHKEGGRVEFCVCGGMEYIVWREMGGGVAGGGK